MLYQLAKPLFFSLEPEVAHDVALKALKLYTKLTGFSPLYKPVRCMGLTFPNRLGLAAGLDKNGAYSDALFKLGFGFVEIGTLTPKPQGGNPKPRLFRLIKDHAIINRMGFNNDGVDHYIEHYANLERLGILGINIGKNKATPNEQAIDDYLYAYQKVYPIADYVTINVSSPNTPDLRQLETGDSLKELLGALVEAKKAHQEKHQKRVPLVVKISPDLDEDGLKVTADLLLEYGIDGVIATNTTLSRENLKSPKQNQQGGLSGEPLTSKSLQAIRALHKHTGGHLPIIGVGGIMSLEDAQAKIDAGASLVQIYTGFIYQGPSLIKKIIKKLN